MDVYGGGTNGCMIPGGASVPWEVGDGRDGAPRAAVQLERGVGGRQGALQQRPRWPRWPQ